MKEITLQAWSFEYIEQDIPTSGDQIYYFCGLRILQNVWRVSDLQETILSEEIWNIPPPCVRISDEGKDSTEN